MKRDTVFKGLAKFIQSEVDATVSANEDDIMTETDRRKGEAKVNELSIPHVRPRRANCLEEVDKGIVLRNLEGRMGGNGRAISSSEVEERKKEISMLNRWNDSLRSDMRTANAKIKEMYNINK
ncbi:hypothetical protein ACFE04_021816 [Oxalis oulophora]